MARGGRTKNPWGSSAEPAGTRTPSWARLWGSDSTSSQTSCFTLDLAQPRLKPQAELAWLTPHPTPGFSWLEESPRLWGQDYLFTRQLLAPAPTAMLNAAPVTSSALRCLTDGIGLLSSRPLTLPYTAFLFLGGACRVLFVLLPHVVKATRGVGSSPYPSSSPRGLRARTTRLGVRAQRPVGLALELVFPLVASWVCKPRDHPQGRRGQF